MAGDSRLVMRAVVSECAHVFTGLESVMDVGGGTGTTARLLANAFPHVKFTVFDQPHVVATMPKSPLVEGIGGSIFEHIPSANAVFMKMIMHNWDDEHSVKILKLCKEAIPAREKGGKVIIVDIVMDANNENRDMFEQQLCWDILMLTCSNGKQREEHEWKKIFFDAGFTDYKITPLGVRSLIEVFP